MTVKENTSQSNAVRLGEMAKDIEFIKMGMNELKDLIKEFKEGYATKEAFGALASRVEDLEDNNKWLSRAVIVSILSSVATVILSFLIHK